MCLRMGVCVRVCVRVFALEHRLDTVTLMSEEPLFTHKQVLAGGVSQETHTLLPSYESTSSHKGQFKLSPVPTAIKLQVSARKAPSRGQTRR